MYVDYGIVYNFYLVEIVNMGVGGVFVVIENFLWIGWDV